MVRAAAAYDATPHLKIDPRLPETLLRLPYPFPRPRQAGNDPEAALVGLWRSVNEDDRPGRKRPRQRRHRKSTRGRRSSSDTYLVQRYAEKQPDNYRSGTRGRA